MEWQIASTSSLAAFHAHTMGHRLKHKKEERVQMNRLKMSTLIMGGVRRIDLATARSSIQGRLGKGWSCCAREDSKLTRPRRSDYGSLRVSWWKHDRPRLNR